MKVIDISAWQTEIDWQGLVDSGVEGVILKIGERSSFDNMFVDHINHAVEYGLQYGVYYFAHACTYDEAVAEADQVAAWLKEYLRGETPPLGIWYDAESNRMLNGDVTECCRAFINQLTNYGHQYNGVYASWSWLSAESSHYIRIEDLPDPVGIISKRSIRLRITSDKYKTNVLSNVFKVRGRFSANSSAAF